jgi:hypothetical protein
MIDVGSHVVIDAVIEPLPSPKNTSPVLIKFPSGIIEF